MASMLRRALSTATATVEALARVILVNVPLYLLSVSELDSASIFVMAYLLLQVVGFCWAFLVNAAFALAARSTALLPPSPSTSSSSASRMTSLQLICTYYVSYATIRVFIWFAQN